VHQDPLRGFRLQTDSSVTRRGLSRRQSTSCAVGPGPAPREAIRAGGRSRADSRLSRLAHIALARIHTFHQQGEGPRDKQAANRAREACRTPCDPGASGANVETLALAAEGQLPRRRWPAALRHLEAWAARDAGRDVACCSARSGCSRFPAWPTTTRARQGFSASRYADHYGDDWWFLANPRLVPDGKPAKGRERGRAMTGARASRCAADNAYAAHALVACECSRTARSPTRTPAGGRQWDRRLYDRRRHPPRPTSTGIRRSGALEPGRCGQKALANLCQMCCSRRSTAAAAAQTPCPIARRCWWRLAAYGHRRPPRRYGTTRRPYASQKFSEIEPALLSTFHVALLAAGGPANRAVLGGSGLPSSSGAWRTEKLAAGPVVPRNLLGNERPSPARTMPPCVRHLEPVPRRGRPHRRPATRNAKIVEDTFIVALIRFGPSCRRGARGDAGPGACTAAPSPRDARWRAAAVWLTDLAAENRPRRKVDRFRLTGLGFKRRLRLRPQARRFYRARRRNIFHPDSGSTKFAGRSYSVQAASSEFVGMLDVWLRTENGLVLLGF